MGEILSPGEPHTTMWLKADIMIKTIHKTGTELWGEIGEDWRLAFFDEGRGSTVQVSYCGESVHEILFKGLFSQSKSTAGKSHS